MLVRLSACAVAVGLAALHAQEPLPRFRAGANLVTVDAYFSKDGTAVSDLQTEEIEILEDDRPQTIESLRLIRAHPPDSPTPQPVPQDIAAARDAVQHPEARVFVLFLDQWHVSFEGSAKSTAALSALLNRVVGAGDLVGVMTPDQPARNLSLTRRSDAVDRMVRDATQWNQRDRIGALDPREREIDLCYPEDDLKRPQFRGVAKEMIERRRERKTLQALDELITHLGTLREERKFVMLLSEGWILFRQNERLAAVLEPGSIPGATGVAATGGRAAAGSRSASTDRGFESCERERSVLALVDHALEVRQLSHRANRANVTFYAVDPRGLAAFDDSIGPLRPATPAEDLHRLSARQGGIRELAANTDGAVVLNTNDVRGGVARMMTDLNAYYLMRYYSSNMNLDGRFRRITVRVSRPGVRVRARTGYLAPTEAEARAAGVTPRPPASLPEVVEPVVRRAALTALRRGPSTGLAYVPATEPRFRRTERLRIEAVLPAGASDPSGRVLTRQGQALPLIVTTSTQEANGQTVTLADVSLAPLAIGEYVLELTYGPKGQRTTYTFRIIP